MTKSLDILADTWEVRQKVGQGTFSQLFVGRNIVDESEDLVAIKIMNDSITDGTVIRWEGEVLKTCSDLDVIPKFIYHGSATPTCGEYLVMELLGGEDLSHLRDRVRSKSSTGLISIHAATYLARQMLRCIKALHSKGYVHRDIKPANFVRKTKDSTKFYIIDFGITKQYRDKDGKIRAKREHAEFRGTTTYASPHAHRCQDLSPRDDIFSLIYVFLDFVAGKLPWTVASRAKDKVTVAATKEEYLADPRKLIDWVLETVKRAEDAHPWAERESNFPAPSQEKTLLILEHLKVSQAPNDL